MFIVRSYLIHLESILSIANTLFWLLPLDHQQPQKLDHQETKKTMHALIRVAFNSTRETRFYHPHMRACHTFYHVGLCLWCSKHLFSHMPFLFPFMRSKSNSDILCFRGFFVTTNFFYSIICSTRPFLFSLQWKKNVFDLFEGM